jgi:hypothetical protein
MPDLQSEQQDLMDEAEHYAGVKDVIDVYNRIAPYAGIRLVQPTVPLLYSTGGNQ